MEEDSSPERLTYKTRTWNNENVLHVYPRTFNEVRKDGEAHTGRGSILGITEKLDWMAESGITSIWLGPIFKSPGKDGNYDVTSYYEIDEELGTMEDVDELIAEAHKLDIRIIFDLVPNHTSDESEWFKASEDPDHPDHEKYKDYYIWEDAKPSSDPEKTVLPPNIVDADGEDARLSGLPADKTVPNNWSSIFSLPQIDKYREDHGGVVSEDAEIPAVTAWVWSEKRQQFYLAEFMKNQPSLQWQNPAVREEIKEVVRFWLNKGVDSFRVDVMNHIGKNPELRNEEPAPRGKKLGEYAVGVDNPHDQNKQENLVSHWPQLGDYTKELLSVLDEPGYEHVRFVFEDWMSALSDDDRLDKLRPDKASVFNFKTLLNTIREKWSAGNFGKLIKQYYTQMENLKGSVPNQVTGNHDVDAIRTRLGSPQTARAAYLMLAALPGAFYTWQSDMMGRPNMIVPKDMQQDGDIGQRDGERTPPPWDASNSGGFSEAPREDQWLPTVDEEVYRNDNMEIQKADASSPYRFVRETLLRRKEDNALREGSVKVLRTDNENVLAFVRDDPDDPRRQVICIVNMSQNTTEVYIPEIDQTRGIVTLSAQGSGDEIGRIMDLTRPITIGPDAAYLVDSMT